MTETRITSGPTQSPVLATFFRFVIPSVLSLLAISTASVVDGFFVGNFIGADALAAVNVLMPYISLLFGVALMLAVGGSVRAGVSLGRGDVDDASAIFSKTLLAVFTVSLGIIPFAIVFDSKIFTALGAGPELHMLMAEYFFILCFAMVVQLTTLVFYYFVRADNFPSLGMLALLIGAASNIMLDAVFIGVFNLGIQGAALATLLAQCLQLAVILRYFNNKNRNLRIFIPKKNWSDLLKSAYNGFSEFVNEISVGIVILVLHWIINRQSGVEGIAAFSVVNYLIFISLMVYYGIVDAMHGLLSQNIGAGLKRRVSAFMFMAGLSVAVLAFLLVLFLFSFRDYIITFFLEEEAVAARDLANELITLVWPLFLFNGFNVLISAYLTSAERAFHSAILAMSRSLVLPLILALVLNYLYQGYAFIYALPLAEAITFVLAAIFVIHFRPSRLLAGEPPRVC